ncbi:unnamed protein product, partial [Sphacelaria rigidula]
VQARGLADPSFFEPDVQIGKSGDHFYALIYERLWDTMLPALENEWENAIDSQRGAVTSFNYSRDEVDTVLANYRDPTGTILRTERQVFKRCSCVDPSGRRRVCVPPKIGWMCERKATLIKHDIILEREQEERRRLALEQEDIDFRVALAKRIVKDRAETIEGKKFYRSAAIKVAEELIKDQLVEESKGGTDTLKAHRRSTVEKKFTKSREKLQKAREYRLTDVKNKVKVMEDEVKELRGWAKEQKEAQIDQALQRMRELPEDKELEELDQKLEQEVERVERQAAAATSRKIQSAAKKKVGRGHKGFQDLVDEMMIDLVQQEMEERGEEAREKAEAEHKVLRRITAMWVGLGMRETFAEWKTWTKGRIKQRRKDARKALREAWHDYEAEGVVGVMAEWKRSFWEESFDVYTETTQWVHK